MSSQITQAEADELIALEKHRVDSQIWNYPALGGSINISLTSMNRSKSFILDITRGRVHLSKTSLQNRYTSTTVLVRLDVGGPRHRNPDLRRIRSPHLHIYTEGYGDRWAFSVPSERFRDLSDATQTLEDFMKYCNIVTPPIIQGGIY